MSHELRTPLNAIIGLTEIYGGQCGAFRHGQSAGTTASRASRRQASPELINQVLDLSKIEAGKVELNPELINVPRLVDEVVGTARSLAEQNNNSLSVECPGDIDPLYVDALRLRQILLNLLSNSCKFTKNGKIS